MPTSVILEECPLEWATAVIRDHGHAGLTCESCDTRYEIRSPGDTSRLASMHTGPTEIPASQPLFQHNERLRWRGFSSQNLLSSGIPKLMTSENSWYALKLVILLRTFSGQLSQHSMGAVKTVAGVRAPADKAARALNREMHQLHSAVFFAARVISAAHSCWLQRRACFPIYNNGCGWL